MFLESVRYRRLYKNNEWEIKSGIGENEALHMHNINLIVGKNASGKSNTILVLDTLADLLSGLHAPKEFIYDTAEFDVVFKDNDLKYEYVCGYKDGIVQHESLFIDGKCMIDREKGEMFYTSIGDMMSFKTDEDMLAISKRDSIQHPYLDPLHDWGKQLRCYHFGSSMGKTRLVKDVNVKYVNVKDSDEVVNIFLQARSMFPQFAELVLSDMSEIGYSVNKIDIKELKSPVREGVGLAISEEGLKDYTDQIEMSSGMFRALSLIIQMEFAILVDKPQCILIDDIGEGLDYDRAWKLIGMIIEKAGTSKMQIIMTTNDRFVMNKVPLQYWQVIARDKGGICFYNPENSPEIFEQFSFTGLNNFDFFASEFYKGITRN